MDPNSNELDFFELYLTDEIYEVIMRETNRFAGQYVASHPDKRIISWFHIEVVTNLRRDAEYVTQGKSKSQKAVMSQPFTIARTARFIRDCIPVNVLNTIIPLRTILEYWLNHNKTLYIIYDSLYLVIYLLFFTVWPILRFYSFSSDLLEWTLLLI